PPGPTPLPYTTLFRSYLEQQVGRVADGPAAPVVGALVQRQQPAVGQEAQAEGVAQPPGDDFQAAAVEVAPHHRGGAGHDGGDSPDRKSTRLNSSHVKS